MSNLARGFWIILIVVYYYIFITDYRYTKSHGKLDKVNVFKVGITGFITNFFDVLGIGSFAPTIAFNKIIKMGVRDNHLPGFLNVGHTLHLILEAIIFTTIIDVEIVTLLTMIISLAMGAWLGAGIISKLDENKIQKVMSVTLFITGIFMILGVLNLIQGGGDNIGLTGEKLIIGAIGNFILGLLITARMGLYAPCMAPCYFLGLSPTVDFPIIMGSCAT